MKHQQIFNVKPLIEARKKRKWTTTDLGARIKRSSSMVQMIESGNSQGFNTIYLMAEALGVPMSKVLIDRKVS